MPISYSEQTTLTCPACQREFEAAVWTLVDTAERPDLTLALQEGTLDRVTCPHCGSSGPSGAPLLLHDPQQRRVYFAVPPGVAEHRWRERAQELLYMLVGSLPEEARLTYLGDVQVEQEIGGVRRAWQRRQRKAEARRAGSAAAPQPAPEPSRAPEPPAQKPAAPAAPLVELVQQLLASDSAADFQAQIERSPVLLSELADQTIGRLADDAYAQGQREIGEALRALRASLADLRRGETAPEVAAPPVSESAPAAPAEPPAERLPEQTYQALLRASTSAELRQTVSDYPALLEGWVDQALSARAEAVLEEGNERLATAIEERREALAELRQSSVSEPVLMRAVEALLHARDESALEQAITTYPALLTEAAQTALLELAAGARARGDTALAEYAAECRAMLRHIRDELG
jgi:hypothetical protein